MTPHRRMREIIRADRWEWPRIIWIEAGQWRYHWRAKLHLLPKPGREP